MYLYVQRTKESDVFPLLLTDSNANCRRIMLHFLHIWLISTLSLILCEVTKLEYTCSNSTYNFLDIYLVNIC